VAYARANPGRLNYGSGGNGSAGHLAGEMFKALAGLFVVHIPYAGGPPAQLALLGGQGGLQFRQPGRRFGQYQGLASSRRWP
jgi:tripartite-type tricarboxylate transporter receptor subunit TctC